MSEPGDVWSQFPDVDPSFADAMARYATPFQLFPNDVVDSAQQAGARTTDPSSSTDPWYKHFAPVISLSGITPADIATAAPRLPFGGPWGGSPNEETFYNRVRRKGPWDIKALKSVSDAAQAGTISKALAEEYGNFLYGVAMKARGNSLAWTLEGAGGYQALKQGYGNDEGLLRHLEGIGQNAVGMGIVAGDNVGSWLAPMSSYDATTARMTKQGFQWGDNPGDSKEILNGWSWANQSR